RRSRRRRRRRDEMTQVHRDAGGGTRAPEARTGLVVSSAARNRIRAAGRERGEYQAALVVEASQLGEIDGHVHARRRAARGEVLERIERLADGGKRRQLLARAHNDLRAAVHRGERRQASRRGSILLL